MALPKNQISMLTDEETVKANYHKKGAPPDSMAGHVRSVAGHMWEDIEWHVISSVIGRRISSSDVDRDFRQAILWVVISTATMSLKSAGGVTIVTESPSKTSPSDKSGSEKTLSMKTKSTALVSVSTRLSAVLEDMLTNEQLMRLGGIFEEADEEGQGGLAIDGFRKAIRMTMGILVTDEELDMIFMKVDTNCDGTVDWEEYITFMLLECRERDLMTTMEMMPFPRVIRFIQSEHRDSVVRIVIVPYVISSHMVAKSYNNAKGRYVACSKDGTVTFWSMSMDHKSSRKVMPASSLHTSVWVTDMACLPRFHFLVFATTARDIQFYDTNANRFVRLSRITGLNACPTALNFHESRWSIAKLLWGDQDGGISCLTFHTNPMLTALNPKRAIGGRDAIPFSDILCQNVEFLEGYYIPCIHRDRVMQLMFSEHLNCVVSISRITETAMFIGDLEQKLTNSYFRVTRGINTFDYSNKLNLVVTGGQDALVRVWNPYVVKKPVSILRGHQSPVTQVHLDSNREQAISIAENKDIRVHDINSHICIQTFFRKMMPDVGFRAVTASVFNEARQALVFATTRLMLLEHRDEDLRHLQVDS
ncbi:WD repeat-containing protein on Y chromosome [Lamellibrachia satsuma]|nr:WD repeat-containing protein on Y chromosome [Lamellibrachia satsuma]